MIGMERLCFRMIRLIHTPIHIYDASGRLTAVHVDRGEQQDVLACDEELLRRLLEKRREEHPVIHFEKDDVVFGVVCDQESTYVVGPCCLGSDPVAAAKAFSRRHKLDAKRPYRIRRIGFARFCEVLLLLFETLTGTVMDVDELYLKCFCDKSFEKAMKEKMEEVFFTLQENSTVHNPYSQELREQESIRTGNLEALYRSFQESYVGTIGTLSHDPLRQAKNLDIVLITLASRSAMQGGLLPEIAFSMSDAFIQRAEELTNLGEAQALGRQAEVEYCKAVAELAAAQPQNALVTRCKALVMQGLHSRLSVQSLARELDITPDYLSRLFLREEGVKLSDYITQEKIRAAKGQLVYSQNSYETIAHSLGFSSQSHFGQLFKKFTGMTPRQFRETHKT